MKQIRRTGLALLGLLLGAALALAEGPDDLFVQVYNLIQEADSLKASGRVQDAQSKYIAASGMLDKLQANYPSWNEKIVNYRRRYIAEQLGPNAAELLAKPANPATTPAPTAPAANADDRVGQLNAEVNALRAERETLQAKLREALSVQPAATDPRELAKAERRLQELKGENETLKNTLAQQQAKLAGLPDAKAFTEAQKALRDAQDALQRQTKSVDSLSKERDALKEKLKRATDKNEARAAREQEKAARASTPAPDTAKLNELETKLKEAQAALSAEKNRSDILLEEKSALQKRVNELAQAKTAPTPVPAPLPTPAAPATAAAPATMPPSTPAPAPSPAETKADKKAQKEAIKLLTRERDELRKRVAVLSRELEERRLNSGTAQKDRIAEELSILRIRLQVYESRQVPYTPEELALFKQTPSVNPKGETAALRRASRQVPAGAATLVVEAQRAFQARRLDEAEKKFQQALMLDEKNLGLLTDLAATHLEQGRLDAAEAELNRAMAIDPNDPDALSLMGLLRFRQAKYDEALDILGRAVLYSPDNALTQNYLGVTLSQKGQRAPAETAFRKAIQLEPNYAEAHFNLAIVYAHAKPPAIELARWHYQKALAGGQPKNAEIESIINAGSATAPAPTIAPAAAPASK